ELAFIRFALNGITTSGFTIGQTMSISSVRDGKRGSTSVDEFDDRSLRDAVQRTEQLALIAPPNPEGVPPLAPQKYTTIENYPDTTAQARNQIMIPHIRAIIESAKASNLVAAGFMERVARSSAIANKRNNFVFARAVDAYLSSTVRDAAGTSSGWAAQPAVRIEEIDGAAVARSAIEKCLGWKNPKRLDPGKYTVVLEPTAVGDLLPGIASGFAARAAEEGRSFLSKPGGGTLLGEKLFPDFITLRTDPFSSLYSDFPWSSGSIPAARITWIEKGVVENLFYDRYWAAKVGRPATPGPDSLVLDGGGKSLNDLIASVERGLLVTRFFYIRTVNPQTRQMTGLTRDGLFLIENGKITSPVVNFRFNESPVRMLQNTIGMGKAVRTRGMEDGMITPPLVVKDFPFTSISDAV
ncbi:MAG: TldD/PmbA family protein, partial [Bryobacteraceae bacterium]